MAGSSDPFADPVISPAYLTDDNDINVIVAGIEISRRIFATPAFQAVSLGEYAPGPDVQTRDEIKHFMQQQGGTIHHPVGTCKMGEDAAAVVDSRLRVHGLAGLRVADASIMPTLTTGNTNAPAIMIGEKCADFIRGHQLAPTDLSRS